MTVEWLIRSAQPQQTSACAEIVANAAFPGLVIGLNGELGAGKTHWTRAFCDALGVQSELVNSPTFVLMQHYVSGRIPVAHFDAYRLGDPTELIDFGGLDYLESAEWVSVVEWSDCVRELLPEDRLEIRLRHTAPTERAIQIRCCGRPADSFVQSLSDGFAKICDPPAAN